MQVFLALVAVIAGPVVRAQGNPSSCTANNAGIRVPDGFCVQVVADSLGAARHVTVAPNGDLLVAIRNSNTAAGQGVTDDGVGSADRGSGVSPLRSPYSVTAIAGPAGSIRGTHRRRPA